MPRGRGRGSWNARARGGRGGGENHSNRGHDSSNDRRPTTMSTPSTTNTNAPRSETISTETRRQMEFMPWISRSSGLEKSGDS